MLVNLCDGSQPFKISYSRLAIYTVSDSSFDFSEFIKSITSEMSLKVERVIFNNPATIILWKDGTKTIVKADEEKYDPEKGLAMGIVKKLLGNKGNYYNEFKKWLPKSDEDSLSDKYVKGDKKVSRKASEDSVKYVYMVMSGDVKADRFSDVFGIFTNKEEAYEYKEKLNNSEELPYYEKAWVVSMVLNTKYIDVEEKEMIEIE